MNIEIGNKKIDFVYQGDNLIYPNYPARENLILHYDFSGMKNSDVTKAIARDLSGNGNNGVLQNFAYADESGYLDNALIFDGIDDFITIPEAQIDLDNFTYSEGGEVLSFKGENVATVVGGVVEIGGRNLISTLPSNWQQGSFSGGSLNIINSYKSRILTTDIEVSPNTQYIINLKDGYEVWIPELDENKSGVARTNVVFWSSRTFTTTSNTKYLYVSIRKTGTSYNSTNPEDFLSPSDISDVNIKLEKGNKATDWTPAPEDLKTKTFKPLFDKKIKSALYWNRALTDEELLQVYNTQIKRI